MPHYYKEDPAELFREHVWINPFWEDKIEDVVGHMGANRVIFGSDWPHMEGMEHPRNIFEELDGISLSDQQMILRDNTAALNQRRSA
jgi:predicted TIM-barrel fold metal-dependent hydrolase